MRQHVRHRIASLKLKLTPFEREVVGFAYETLHGAQYLDGRAQCALLIREVVGLALLKNETMTAHEIMETVEKLKPIFFLQET